jgi:predicted MPP superfamily phosphohydrolase
MIPRRVSRFVTALLLAAASFGPVAAQQTAPGGVPAAQAPAKPAPAETPAANSLKFAIIGDSGSGSPAQIAVANRLVASRTQFPYEFVLMLGDNLYGGHDSRDYAKKFELPYKPLLDEKIKFYAALGNHDDPSERLYKQFNMNGQRFYTFKAGSNVRMFALDSNYLDQAQLAWFEKELQSSGSDWKIVFFHHPIYSSGGAHGSDLGLRRQLEPLFLAYGVDVVLAGHDHFYERIKPQKGIYYFVSGGAGQLREGDVNTRTGLTAKSYDTGYHFMLVEVTKDTFNFRAINQDGQEVDSGALPRVSDDDKKKNAGAAGVPLPKGAPAAAPAK